MAPSFQSPEELKEVLDKTFALMSEDPDMGPKLKDADTPQRFEFDDVALIVNVRAAREGEEGNLHWQWSDTVDWEPRVRMTMSSQTANRYFPGKENVAMAIARRRVLASTARRGGRTMGTEFDGPKEFRTVMDRIFTMMSEDPDMGPKLRDADVPQRFEFPDVDMVVNIRAAEEGEDGCLFWQWNDDINWKPKVKMTMSSEVANKYFQGKENIPIAIARRRIKTSGDVKAALALIPITKPVYAQYRAVVEAEYPHLKA